MTDARAGDPGRTIDLRPLFAPRSIAVVGASPRSSLARVVRDNLAVMGGGVRCHFVNPNYDRVWGSPCYPSLEALPERPDSAVLAVNPFRAARFAREAAAAGVGALVIPGGGVVEGGEAALAMQREVREIAIEHRLALLGPNCMGMVDWTTGAAAYIGDVSPYLPRGHVAGLAQSGSVTDAFLHSGTRIGFSRIVSVGSEVALDLCDHLAYSLADPETHVVVLFVEGFKRPERFLALADHALALGKPVLALKVGRSAQAQAAALAHTGSLAGEDRATDAALAAAGVVRCGDLDELLEAAELFAGADRLGRNVGAGRTGVVTVSTGEASLVADLAPRSGLDLPPVPDATREAILAELPTMGYVGNPIDPWGAGDPAFTYRVCLEAFADAGVYDVLAVVHDSPYRELPGEVEVALVVARPLVEAAASRPGLFPVVVSLTSGEVSPALQALLAEAGGVPLLRGALEAELAIARRAWWEGRHRRRLAAGPARPGWPALAADPTPWAFDPVAGPAGIHVAPGPRDDRAGRPAGTAARVPGRPPAAAARVLPERESLERLASAGVAVTPFRAVPDDEDEVLAAWRDLGRGPVAIKLDAPGLAHKSDMGGVRLGLRDEASLRAATVQLRAAAADAGIVARGLLVQPMAPPGVELIVGGRRDAAFGPLVLVGLGGVLAEVLDDVALALAPVRPEEARAMLGRLRGRRLLDGPPGAPAPDASAIAALVSAVGRHLAASPDVAEIDLNPVVAGPWGALAVDALVVLRD